MGLLTVWDEGCFCSTSTGFPSATKPKEVVERASALGLIELREPAPFDEAATWEDLVRVHDAAYVSAVRTGTPRALAESSGLPWSEARAASVARIWSGHAQACRLALETGLVFHPVSGAHHARKPMGGGFCTFNFLVGAAAALSDERFLIVDLDTHQGNGTWELLSDDDRVAIFDISGAEFGVPEVETETRFSRLVRSADDYAALLERLPGFVERFRPSILQYQAGMDCHEEDLLGGIRGMTAERLWERDAFVFELARSLGIPLVFNLAGGYQGETTVELHLGTVRAASR